jgi:transcriptional regulator with XRE-family HTH domain
MSSQAYKLYENPYVRYDIHNVVATIQEDLSDFVRRVLKEKNLSYRKAAAKSGGLITHSTVSDVVNKRVENLSSTTVEGLARGLGVTQAEIYSRLSGKAPDDIEIGKQRVENLSLKFGKVPATKKERAQALFEMLDRELDLLIED